MPFAKTQKGATLVPVKMVTGDFNPGDIPGIVCMQINECADASMHDCNDETQVCVDLPPPSKWQCVERYPCSNARSNSGTKVSNRDTFESVVSSERFSRY
jgi:hypothetical protein